MIRKGQTEENKIDQIIDWIICEEIFKQKSNTKFKMKISRLVSSRKL